MCPVCHSDVALRDMEVMASEWQQAESKFTYVGQPSLFLLCQGESYYDTRSRYLPSMSN